MGVLAGYRVLDVSTHGAVPIAGSVLADWGADVIKVEDPEHGEVIRGGTVVGRSATRGRVQPPVPHLQPRQAMPRRST